MEHIPIKEQVNLVNIATKLDKSVLDKIYTQVSNGYAIDKTSRQEWGKNNSESLKLAAQVREPKSFPWNNAANIKYPLVSTAVLQFASRAYQQLIPTNTIVRGQVIGEDPYGLKRKVANNISHHMTYQLREQMDGWEDDEDRLQLVIAICGNAYKKTYRVPGKNKSELVLPTDLIVNYFAKSIETASRKSHIIPLYENELETKYRTGEFIRPEDGLPTPVPESTGEAGDKITGTQPPSVGDSDSPRKVIEQHCFYDLDGDGYREPVIVTWYEDTSHIFRIVAGYEIEDVIWDGDKVIEIPQEQYFTNTIFIPCVDSGIHGIGFGTLLGPINETANTIINQMLDAGTLSNLPCGFLGRGAKLPGGKVTLSPGVFKQLRSSGEDIAKNVFLMPTKEPSMVMYQLLGLMIQGGKELSSVSNLMSGESPGQNQPYSTTKELLQQGLQVFSSIVKREHRSLKKEFKKLYKLNKKYLSPIEYFTILDTDNERQGQIRSTDYQGDGTDVIPASDPTILTDAEKLAKAEQLMIFSQMGTVNPQIATKRALEAQGQEGIEELMTMPESQPDFDQQIKLQELEIRKMEVQGEQQLQAFKTEAQAARDMANTALAYAKAEALKGEQMIEQFKIQMEAISKEADRKVDLIMAQMKMITDKSKGVTNG